YSASLDGADFDFGEIVEIKCPISGTDGALWKAVMFGEVPEYYRWQLVQQAYLSQAKTVHFFVYVDDQHNTLITLDGEELRSEWPALQAAWDAFLPTLADDIPEGESRDPEILAAAAEYDAAKDEADAVEARLEAAKKALLALVKQGDTVIAGGIK